MYEGSTIVGNITCRKMIVNGKNIAIKGRVSISDEVIEANIVKASNKVVNFFLFTEQL